MSRGTETRQERPEDQDLVKKGYTFVKKIGSGSYGKVWLAEFHNDGRSMKLACKIVNLERMPPKFARKFFPRELDIIMWVDHAYVIRTHSILERQHQVFIFMQYADSGDLLDYLKKYGVLPEINAHIWFKQLTLGLQYLHGKKVAHRDLKCENLLLTKNFNIKIADFGFARYVVDSDGKRVLSETYCGSAAYAAPEVIRGTPYNPVMSDIWSAGVVLYVMVNPSMPFDDSDAKKLLRNQETRNWAFRSSVRDRLTPAIKDVVTRMLEPDVTSRITLDQILRHEWLSENTLKELVAEHDAMKKTKEQEKRAQPIPGQQALRVPDREEIGDRRRAQTKKRKEDQMSSDSLDSSPRVATVEDPSNHMSELKPSRERESLGVQSGSTLSALATTGGKASVSLKSSDEQSDEEVRKKLQDVDQTMNMSKSYHQRIAMLNSVTSQIDPGFAKSSRISSMLSSSSTTAVSTEGGTTTASTTTAAAPSGRTATWTQSDSSTGATALTTFASVSCCPLGIATPRL